MRSLRLATLVASVITLSEGCGSATANMTDCPSCVVLTDGGKLPGKPGGSVDAGHPSEPAHTTGQSLIWVWYDYANSLASVASHAGSFTHVSPALYQINYAYTSGTPQFTTGSDNFDGLSSAQIVAKVHAAGLKCVPLIYGGAANAGTDQGIQNILNDSPGGTQQAFIDALVSEGVAKGYDGWNLDWEVNTDQTAYASYGTKLNSFLGALKTALHAHSMTLSFDLGTWYIKQTNCSGGNGVADLAALGANVDLAILEDYGSTLGSGSSCPASLTNPQPCDSTFISALNLMCVYLPPGVVSIGVNAKSDSNNLIAGASLSTLEAYGIKNVAIWPDYNQDGPGGSYVLLDPAAIKPTGSTWYGLLADFLAHYPAP